MTNRAELDNLSDGEPHEGFSGFLSAAGFRYWTASILPALVGTLLPLWLRPPDFSFRWLGAVEFLLATILFHAGLSFLHALFENRSTTRPTRPVLIGCSCACIVAAALLALLINSGIQPREHVFKGIFIVFCISAGIVGLLFATPPVNLGRQIGREIVIAKGLGMMPVLGAYLVQVADLTRTVYLASLPIVVATGLWAWTNELVTRADDQKHNRRSLVTEFGPRFAGRFGVLALVSGLIASILVAVLSKSLSPWALLALPVCGFAYRIVTVSWNGYSSSTKMITARRKAFLLHLLICMIIAASSLLTPFT